MIEALLEWVTDALTHGGGWALGVVMLVENLFPPIPSEAVLPLAGFLVSQGALNVFVAVAVATAGSLFGALALYALGRWGGRPLIYRWRWVLRVDESQLDRADTWFDQHGPPLVFWLRMVPLARSVISIPAGASEMPVVRFSLLTAAGSLLWNTVLIVAGMLLQQNWEVVADVGRTYTAVVVAVLVVGAAVVVAVWARRRGRRG